ncbi:MAG: hypothetical protein OZ921_04755 [Sorangiineae bacterium]|nr:hypothetical protein [Polyangiaceae bacterium]MEB2321801.1 hypothetical protein [Sorangiineae bacterium]
MHWRSGSAWSRLSLVLTTLEGVLASAPAAAQSCPNGAWGTDIPVRITTERFPVDTNQTTDYGNNTNYGWGLYMQPSVAKLRARVAQPYFWTEPNYDYMFALGDNLEYNQLTGFINAGYLPGSGWTPAPTANYGAKMFYLGWFADGNVGRYARRQTLDSVQLQCSSGFFITSSQPISTSRRYDGILTGTSNVLYFNVTQPANTKLIITVDHLATTPGGDFDLYTSTSNSFPHSTGTASDWSISGAADESITVYPTGAARTIYIGVVSHSGAGHFSLHAYQVKQTRSINVCTQVSWVGQPSWNDFIARMKATSVAVLNATNGNQFINQYNVYLIPQLYDEHGTMTDNCYNYYSTGCKICIRNPDGLNPCGTQTSSLGGASMLPAFECASYWKDLWAPVVNAHELGHALFSLFGSATSDEYSWNGTTDPTFCGHSIMNGPRTHILCTPYDHCKDYNMTPPSGSCGTNTSSWSKLISRGFATSSTQPGATADATWSQGNASLLSKVDVFTH